MPVKPMLGDLELQLVQEIESDQDRVLEQHSVPALEGDFLQQLGRRASTITLTGLVEGEEARDGLKALREKFNLAEPVDFVADIATAARVDQVMIEEMGVRELAGKPLRYEYAFTLREYLPPPAPREVPPPPPPPPPPNPQTGRLEIRVVVCNRPEFDFSTVTVSISGTREDGTSLSRTLTNRSGNLWTEAEFPPGSYTARATTDGPPPMQGEEQAVVRGGQLTQITIELCDGQVPLIAKMFVVHFHFDKAFVEPCMRRVLEQVAAYSDAHAGEKMLVIGHTDLTGSDQYNQSLSERRARSVFGYLTIGGDPASALRDWDQLRRARQTGTALSLNDTWDRREYQYILQDLGYYHGNIQTENPSTAEDNALTDAAVRQFQTDHALTPDGIVGDDTWGALISDYLNQNALNVPADRLLPNAKNGCDAGKLKWLGNGEKDPVENTQNAWRPNRRTEILFVNADALPADAPQPDTFNLPAPGGFVNSQWCLNPSGTSLRSCYVKPHIDPPLENCTSIPPDERWPRQPAEPGDIIVSGRIQFEDGSPLADTPYVLIAPDGKFMDGEHLPPSDPLRGWPIPGRTGSNGEFAYTEPSGIGIYTMEVRAPVVARAEGQPIEDAKGNVVCKRLEPSDTGNQNVSLVIIVVDRSAVSVRPSITAPAVVVVKKTYTNPVRQPVVLRADGAFTGSGTFTRSSDAVLFFDAAVGGNEITFDGVDNLFTDAQLTAGVNLFAEGARASAALDDVELRLALTVGGAPGLAATARMTAVELTLDICVSRTSPTADPAPLSVADKINPGRFLQAALASNAHERAMLIVRQAQPAAFAGELVLLPVNPSVRMFSDEVPHGEAPLPAPHVVPNTGIPAAGQRFFAEGVNLSATARDTGFMLGIRNLENEGDRVAVTVGQIEFVSTATAAAPADTFARIGLWDNAFRAAGTVFNDTADANNFVGADTRRFFIRLRDVSRSGTGFTDIEWRTVLENGDDLFTPTNRTLTLVEIAANPGVFVSRAVMLVTDNDDQNQDTHTSLPAGTADAGVVRSRNQSNHRLRRANLRTNVAAEYNQPAVAGVRISNRVPVFERTPEFRRRLPVQIFVLRVAAGGAGVIPTAPGSQVWTRDMRVAEESYARIGVQWETIVAPGTPAADIQEERPLISNETVLTTGPNALTLLRVPMVRDARNQVEVRLAAGGTRNMAIIYDDNPAAPAAGQVKIDRPTGRLTFNAAEVPGALDQVSATYVSVGHRVVLINAPAGVNPLNVNFAPTNDEETIGTAFPAQPSTARVFYTGGLGSGNRGEAWPAVDFAGTGRVNACFVDGSTYTPYTVTHEVGHILTNKSSTVSTGHYLQPAAPAGNRLETNQNLMRNGTSAAEGVNQSKRLWDAPDIDALNQFATIRNLHGATFLRPF